MIETGGSPARIEVVEKSWSEWVRFMFTFSMLQSVTGIARFYIRQIEPQIEAASATRVNQAIGPWVSQQASASYAKDLAGEIGLFSGQRCAACRAGKTFTPGLMPPMLRICW